ncbi:hypothetical protein FACS1894190_09510 [Spirochaetia bacterium]|nr:hypothetical protein FACS1894190_09510 [Spirochaetia bacterium]
MEQVQNFDVQKNTANATQTRQNLAEHVGFVEYSQDNRAMLASINAYKQAIEKALATEKK